MRDPVKVLKKLRRCLKDNGVVIATIPNLRNAVPLLKIITDRFEYEDAGILDRTHLRFFTLHTMRMMFREAGFTVVQNREQRSRSWQLRLFNVLTLGLLRAFTVYQFTLVAVKDDQVSRLGTEGGKA
jgi:hypothetical protein